MHARSGDRRIYLGTQHVDDARIAEDHQRQRQKELDERYDEKHRFHRGKAAEVAPR